MRKPIALARGAEAATFLLLAAIPLLVHNAYALGLLTLLAIYGILLIGLDVTVGYLGQVNLGHAAFLGLGAYTAGLTVKLPGFGLPGALAAATLVGVLSGALLAFPALRLEGPQFALATLSFLALNETVLNEWQSLTGGAQGLTVARPALFGHALHAQAFYWLCLALLAFVWITMRHLLSSHWGRAFEALRDSPIATDAMGIGAYRHKAAAFAMGSGLGGFAGGLYAFNFQYLQPEIFVYELMVVLLLGVILGGRKSLWGAFAGACIIVLLPNLLSNRHLFQSLSAGAFALFVFAAVRGLNRKTLTPFQALAPVVSTGILLGGAIFVLNTEDWRRAIFALMLFSVIVGLPEGLMGFATRFFSGFFHLPPEPLPEAAPLGSVLADGVRAEPSGRGKKEPLLEIQGLTRYFGGVKAVDGVSLVVERGVVHGLIGPNGSGKSTLVNVVSGLYPPTAGTMRFKGAALPQGNLFRAARRGIARTFQNLQLFSELSALENVMAAMTDAYRCPLPLLLLGFAKEEERRARSRALALLDFVGLAEYARSAAKHLPYGAQRFLEIARALARRPDLLILDEPAAGLAAPDLARLKEIVRSIHQRGITVVLIEHHMDVISELCDRVTALDNGKVIAEGAPAEIQRHPAVVEAYLGTAA